MGEATRCAPQVRWIAAAIVVAATAHGGCGRVIEDEEPPELVEHRLEPCRKWCEPFLSLECGQRPEDRPDWTVEDCVEDCAAVEPVYGWEWSPEEDGTDACAEEWSVVAECVDALTCEEQRSMFRYVWSPTNPDFPCKAELDMRSRCHYRWIEGGGGE